MGGEIYSSFNYAQHEFQISPKSSTNCHRHNCMPFDFDDLVSVRYILWIAIITKSHCYSCL